MSATRAELERALSAAGFQAAHGFRIRDVEDGACTLEVPYRKTFERPGGVVSGPVFMAAADAAMWLAVLSRLGAGDASVTAEITTAFLAPAREEDFTCTARVLKWGRRLIYGVADCVAGDGRALAHHTLWYARGEPAPRAASR